MTRSTPNKKSRQLFTQGVQHCQAERWAESLTCLTQALKLDGDNPSIHHFLGVVYNGVGHHTLAEKHLTLTVAAHPDDYNALLQLGLAHMGCKDFNKAAASFQHVIVLAPEHTEAHFFLAQSFEALDSLADAIASYKRAIALHPTLYQAFYNLGLIYYNLNNLHEADHCFSEVVSLAPTCMDAWRMLGQSAHSAGRSDLAAHSLSKAASLAPDSDQGLYNLGLALHQAGMRREGLTRLNAALKLHEAGKEIWGPQRVRIEVSSLCNLRCRHCPTGTSYKGLPRSLMPPDLYALLLSQLKEIRNLADCVMYLGGEPLLHPDLPAMIRQIKQETSVVRVIFNTNGMLLSKSLCRRLADCGINRIEISVDGRSPEENNAIRTGSDYYRVKENIHLLRRLAPSILVCIANTLIRRPFDPELPEIPSFLLQDFPGLPIQSNYAMHWPGMDLTNSAMASAATRLQEADRFCSKPFTELAVRANGDVVPCCYDLASELVLGNIRGQTLLAIWQGKNCADLRNVILQDDTSRLPALCRKCIVYTGAMPVMPQPAQ
jgi:radical SAM protein with 4Fe4S-binding SPASM domain